MKIYNNIVNQLNFYDKNYVFKDKIILEIGPGDNLLLSLIFLLNGAKRVYSVDKYKRIYDDSFNLKIYNTYLNKFWVVALSTTTCV